MARPRYPIGSLCILQGTLWGRLQGAPISVDWEVHLVDHSGSGRFADLLLNSGSQRISIKAKKEAKDPRIKFLICISTFFTSRVTAIGLPERLTIGFLDEFFNTHLAKFYLDTLAVLRLRTH